MKTQAVERILKEKDGAGHEEVGQRTKLQGRDNCRRPAAQFSPSLQAIKHRDSPQGLYWAWPGWSITTSAWFP